MARKSRDMSPAKSSLGFHRGLDAGHRSRGGTPGRSGAGAAPRREGGDPPDPGQLISVAGFDRLDSSRAGCRLRVQKLRRGGRFPEWNHPDHMADDLQVDALMANCRCQS